MNPLETASETVQRAMVAGVILYFAVFIYASMTGDPTARISADILFGIIALGVGTLLIIESPRELSPIVAAGSCLAAGGVAQLGWVLTRDPLLDLVAALAVFVGVALYVYVVWIAD
ncbi:Ycf66 family protein [Halobacteria archaeon AArc-m2/3/4]|uniref:Ycf66 family protein n=1 Tax=Natronoglomus mannanivorans TaxID=2979990 RepID=A0AAP2YYN5_9EURY|nr:Ycf66 family protein [Halobacteria archaeon AArc-xg1-1]MCU4975101.1 Ycf66 family protein [Halobacteria archaeon AArc-m2/3/4]